MNYGLKFTPHREQAELNRYSDADWAGDVDTRYMPTYIAFIDVSNRSSAYWH